ncbi:hypothetical protein [Dickeya fangzhongdai]|uniref:hypothetical protein n=1 Tax=Dickeya fangzhongdai TaxID=1778540 RepID=UPI00103E3DC1|nr:hypothetical protein [Dickeya fangzhongdai]
MISVSDVGKLTVTPNPGGSAADTSLRTLLPNPDIPPILPSYYELSSRASGENIQFILTALPPVFICLIVSEHRSICNVYALLQRAKRQTEASQPSPIEGDVHA